MARHTRPRLGRRSVVFRTKPLSKSSSDSSAVVSSGHTAGWRTTSEATEGIVGFDHEVIHGTRLDSSKKQIRLLQILPRSLHPQQDPQEPYDDTVHCQMFKTCLDENDPRPPVFNTLSYAWGSPDDLTNIVINERATSVGSNLESVLRHLRDYHVSTTCGFPLWVDAICINQDDDEERNDQVQMMGDIYQRAHRVLAWLGEGDVDTDWLVPLLKDERFRDQAKKADLEINFAPEAALVRAAAILMEDLSSRTWWGRLWVSQEIILAKQDPVLIFGNEYVPWSDYIRIFGHLSSIDSRIDGTKDYEATTNSLYVSMHSGLPFVYREKGIYFPGFSSRQLDRFRAVMQRVGFIPLCTLYTDGSFLELSATIESDFVYALRGLLPPEEQQMIQVDYSKPRMHVFHDAMVVAWTSSFGVSDLGEMPRRLNFCRPADWSPDGVDDVQVPSWVPDLSQHVDHDKSLNFMSWQKSWRTINVRLSPDKQTLTLRGIYFDAISDSCYALEDWTTNGYFSIRAVDPSHLRRAVQIASEALGREIPPSDALHKLGAFRDFERGHFKILRTLLDFDSLPDDGIQHEWLWRGLWAQFLDEGPDDAVAATPRGLRIQRLRLFAEEELRRRPIGLTADYCVGKFLTAIRARLEGTMVYTTRAGFVGVGPGHTRPGDRIVFPFGMRWPFVVRPLGAPGRAGTHEYTMIGVAEVAELSDRRERLDKAFEGGLFEEIDIHLK